MRAPLLLHGLVAGIVLSAARAPRGLDWTELPGASPWTAALMRGAALLVIALWIDGARAAWRDGVRAGTLLGGAALGYALHGFGVPLAWTPESRAGLAAVLVIGAALLRATSGARAQATDRTRPARAELVALGVAAAGLALALETLAHQVRLLGTGLPGEATVIATVLLLGLWIGALAFGPAVATRPQALLPGVALAALATLVGLHLLTGLDGDGLWRYLQRFDLDLSHVGDGRAAALLAGTSLVVPAFLLGATLAASDRPERLRALVVGGAAGLLSRPLLTPVAVSAGPVEGWAWRVAAVGIALALLAALWRALLERRPVALGLVVLSAAALLVARPSPWRFSPWYQSTITPELVLPGAAGLVTLETPAGAGRMVTVDRRRVTPALEEHDEDVRLLLTSLALVPPARRAEGPVSVLLVGQATAERAQLLESLPIERLDRTVPWTAAARVLDERLGVEGSELLSPREARRRLRDGAYDLVVALPTRGALLEAQSAARRPSATLDAPALAALDVPEGTVGVAWVDAAAPLGARTTAPWVVVELAELEAPLLGIVRGAVEPEEGPEAPLLFHGWSPAIGRGVPERLFDPPWTRFQPEAAETFARLAAANPLPGPEAGTPERRAALVARALAGLFAAQEPSSPFETRAQQLELPEDVLRDLTLALREAPGLDRLTRSTWESIARILTAKRMPDLVLAYVGPVAEAYGPWTALELALARAEVELLQEEAALARYERLFARDPGHPEAALEGAAAARRLGEPRRGLDLARSALALWPGERALRREAVLARLLLGDEDAPAEARALLEEDPDDEELRAALAPLPAPSGPIPED